MICRFGKGVFKILECRSRRMAGKQWIQHHRSYRMASFRWALLPWKKCKEVKVIAMTQISWLGKSMGISNYLFLGELKGLHWRFSKRRVWHLVMSKRQWWWGSRRSNSTASFTDVSLGPPHFSFPPCLKVGGMACMASCSDIHDSVKTKYS